MQRGERGRAIFHDVHEGVGAELTSLIRGIVAGGFPLALGDAEQDFELGIGMLGPDPFAEGTTAVATWSVRCTVICSRPSEGLKIDRGGHVVTSPFLRAGHGGQLDRHWHGSALVGSRRAARCSVPDGAG
ncbi:MAG: hypothetical protein WBQ75_12605 [Acetobacteraceae bacterium]